MATPTSTVDEILKMKGRLVKDPTNLANPFPHGGTELGLVRDIRYRPGIKTRRVRAEEFGRVVEGIIANAQGVIVAVLRGWDVDAITAIYPFSAVGGSGAPLVTTNPSSANAADRAGRKVSDSAFTLVFAPTDEANHLFVIFDFALPMLEDTAELQFEIGTEFGLPVMFEASARASDGRAEQIGRRADVTVS